MPAHELKRGGGDLEKWDEEGGCLWGFLQPMELLEPSPSEILKITLS